MVCRLVASRRNPKHSRVHVCDSVLDVYQRANYATTVNYRLSLGFRELVYVGFNDLNNKNSISYESTLFMCLRILFILFIETTLKRTNI